MKSSVMIKFLLVLTALVAVSACSNNDGNEWERLVCEVESVNGGTPLVSFYVLVSDTDAEYPIDIVPVLFTARPYSSEIVLPEDSPQSTFQVTSYDLIWHPDANAPAEMTDFNVSRGLASAIVPVFDDAQVDILIADRGMKEAPWFSSLAGTTDSFAASCELIFYGHESGSTREVAVPAGMRVTFYGTGVLD